MVIDLCHHFVILSSFITRQKRKYAKLSRKKRKKGLSPKKLSSFRYDLAILRKYQMAYTRHHNNACLYNKKKPWHCPAFMLVCFQEIIRCRYEHQDKHAYFLKINQSSAANSLITIIAITRDPLSEVSATRLVYRFT